MARNPDNDKGSLRIEILGPIFMKFDHFYAFSGNVEKGQK